MNNRVISLTKIFLKDLTQNFKIFKNKKSKSIKESNFFWMIIIIAVAVAYISYKAIEVFVSVGQPQIFLNVYFIIFTIFLLMQIILTAMNVLFFSKDLEYILPMPISSTEILLAKYAVIIIMTYVSELLFMLIPMIIYGMSTSVSLFYFIIMPIALLIFPIFFVTFISILTILFMGLFKIIKNKNMYQGIVVTLLIYIVFAIEMSTMTVFDEGMSQNINEGNTSVETVQEESKIQEELEEEVIKMYQNMGKNYLVVNPTVEILANSNNMAIIIINLGKLILYNVIALVLLVVIGQNRYLKNILISTSAVSRKKKNIKKRQITKIKKKGIARAYIGKEFKQLLRNSTFFMQLILPIVIIFIAIAIVGNVVIPLMESMVQSDETVREALMNVPFDTTMLCIILCILQVLYSIPAISLTAISRQGKNAIFMKYVPVSLYKQFLYKNVIQLVVNFMVSIIVLGIAYIWIPNISFLQILLVFLISMFISLINSFLMLLVDLRRPQLNWDSEYEITKNSSNKIFQYTFMIIMVLVYMYLAKVLKEVDMNIAILIELGIFAIAFFGINMFIKKKINKIFDKII